MNVRKLQPARIRRTAILLVCLCASSLVVNPVSAQSFSYDKLKQYEPIDREYVGIQSFDVLGEEIISTDVELVHCAEVAGTQKPGCDTYVKDIHRNGTKKDQGYHRVCV